MDIVKERKRRLFAYLMVIVLGLYMHPTAALKAAEPTESTNITVIAKFDSNDIVPTEEWTLTTVPEGVYDDGSQWYKREYAVGTTVTVEGMGTGTHRIVEWTDLSNSGNQGQGKNSITLPDNATINPYLLSGHWGIYVKLMYGTHKICDEWEETNDGSDELTFDFPILSDDEICKYGKFFNKQWNVRAENGVELVLDESITKIKFSELYELQDSNAEIIINVVPEESNYTDKTVPDTGGSFGLEQGTEYTLGKSGSTWTVGDDGYTYAGGITFYVPENNTYNFSKK